MKKLHLIAILLVTLSTFTLSSCKDEKDKEEVSPRTSLLTDGEWRGDAIYAGAFPVTTILKIAGETELAEALNIKDARFNFERDGTFTVTKNGVTETGTWRFANNEENLIITGDNLSLTGGNASEVTFHNLYLTPSNFNLDINVQDLGYDLSQYGNFNTVQLRLVK